MKFVLKIVTFIALFMFVVAVMVTIFLFMNPASFQKGELSDKVEKNFSTILNLQLPIIVESVSNSSSIKGKIIENTIDSAYSPAEALLESRSLIGLEITDDEYLWPESLTELPLNEDIVWPITFKWLSYSKYEAEEVLTELAKNSLPIDTQFDIQNISYNKLEAVDNPPTTYILYSQLNVITDRFIDPVKNFEQKVDENKESNLEPEKVIKYLKIIETSTGWLNVRTGPSTVYEIITKVDIGEEFKIIKEEDGWFNIRLQENSPEYSESEGWVYGDYIEKINNN